MNHRMVNRFFRTVIAALLAMSLFVSPVLADDIWELENENDELQAQLEEERANLEAIRENITSIEQYIADLDAELERISAIIADYEAQKVEKQANIDELTVQIGELQEQIDIEEEEIRQQYEYMKLRIVFLYENTGDSYIEAIFSSASFSEAVEKIEYLLELTNYDRKVMKTIEEMAQALKDDQDQLSAQVEEQERQMAEIDALEQAQEAQQELYEETRILKEEELAIAYTEMANAEEIIAEFSAQIAANQEIIDEYDRQMEAARQAEEEQYYYEEGGGYEEPVYSGSYFIWPLPGGYSYITSYFGPRYDDDVLATGADDYHYGIDIYAPTGTPIYAVMDGVVISSFYSDGVGNVAIFYHGDGLFTEYHHMNAIYVWPGEGVYQGQTVGEVGATGQYCTGPHLHFGVSVGSSSDYNLAGYVNPLGFY